MLKKKEFPGLGVGVSVGFQALLEHATIVEVSGRPCKTFKTLLSCTLCENYPPIFEPFGLV